MSSDDKSVSISWTESKIQSRYDNRVYNVEIFKGDSVSGDRVVNKTNLTDRKVSASLDYGTYTVRVRSINTKYASLYSDTTKTFTVEKKEEVPKHRVDVNGELDGIGTGNIDNFGTCDVYINGKLVKSDVGDYCTEWPVGTKYEIKNIKTATGCTYNGVVDGALSGTVEGHTSIRLSFSSVSSLNISKASLVMNKGDTADLTVEIKPDNSPTKTVTWASGDTKVATVDENGRVTAVDVGKTNVTAKAGDKSAVWEVTVGIKNDVNDDGKVNNKDIVALFRLVSTS